MSGAEPALAFSRIMHTVTAMPFTQLSTLAQEYLHE